MTTTLQAVRGMNDILPDECVIWQHVEAQLRDTLASYDYREIRFPIIEKTELFKRTIGDTTDIVTKEMYSFIDRNGEQLSLRPEGTAVCVRAGLEHGLLYNQIQKLWYLGPFYRHERPQKGRYRQFFQCGVEAFGLAGPDIDAEIILITQRLLKTLGLLPHISLQLNSLGSSESRAQHREQLIRYFKAHEHLLDDESQQRLAKNPLRILDSKNPALQHLIQEAPRLDDSLDTASREHFKKLCALLDSLDVKFTLNPYLVRGLDYYNFTVFEWVTTALGTQGTVCAGGRYDHLVAQLGGKPTPAIGCAFGMERIVLLLQSLQLTPPQPKTDLYVIATHSDTDIPARRLCEQLREQFPTLRLTIHCDGSSLSTQLKRADKGGAKIAIIVNHQLLLQQQFILKFLDERRVEEIVNMEQLMARLLQIKFLTD